MPYGDQHVVNDLLFTALYTGTLIALDRATGAIVFGNTVLVPAGGPKTSAKGGGGNPQLVAYTIP